MKQRLGAYALANEQINCVFDTIRRERAAAGKSHSKVTPTTTSPAPTANSTSVADGNSETIRTPRRLEGIPATRDDVAEHEAVALDDLAQLDANR